MSNIGTLTDSSSGIGDKFNLEKYLRQYNEEPSLADSPVHLERLKFLIETFVSDKDNDKDDDDDNSDNKKLKGMEDSSTQEQDALILLFQSLEQKLLQVGNMKLYWKLFQTNPCHQDDQRQQLYYSKNKPLPQSLGIHFNQELYDQTLISQANKATTLKANLSTAQHLISKESIRNAHLHLAQFYTRTGSYDEGISHLKRVKEYSSTGTQLMEVTLLIAELGLAMGQYTLVQSLYDTNAHHHLMSSNASNSNERNEMIFRCKLNIARGIAYMVKGSYKEAYTSFLSSSPSDHHLTDDVSFLVHTKDIAMYTGLMALMVLNRKEMEECMSKTVFKSRFDSMIGLKDALMYYSRANYGACMNSLDTMYSSMTHDLFLKHQLDDLWKKIKGNCLVQYFQPYSSVSLNAVRDLFVFPSTEEVEDIVSDLIESGELKNVKIDGVNQTLVGVNPNELECRKKRNMMRKLATVGDSMLNDVENVVTRLTCMEHGIVVPAKRRGGGLKGTMSHANTSGNMSKQGRRRDWSVAMSHKDGDDYGTSEDEDVLYANEYNNDGGKGRGDVSDDRELYMDMDPDDEHY